MSDVALIMALPNESKGLFEQAGIEVHYSGIGKVNAAYKAFEVIQKTGCKTLINLGTAGSTYFDKHELVEVSQFVQRDMDVSPLGFAVGFTPFDTMHPAEIHLEPFSSSSVPAFVEQGIALKQVSPKYRVIWLIWKDMRWQRSVKNRVSV